MSPGRVLTFLTMCVKECFSYHTITSPRVFYQASFPETPTVHFLQYAKIGLVQWNPSNVDTTRLLMRV